MASGRLALCGSADYLQCRRGRYGTRRWRNPHRHALLQTEGMGVRLGEQHKHVVASVGEHVDAHLKPNPQPPADSALSGGGQNRRGGDVYVMRAHDLTVELGDLAEE